MITPGQLAAQTVKAEFQIGLARIPINQINITHTIDELPHATVSVQLDNVGSLDAATRRFGAVAMNLDKFNALTRATQEKILNDYRVDPDTQLVVQDGEYDSKKPNDGHELRLKGFLGKPEFRIREGDVFLNYSLVHAKAVMQAFNTRIYGAQDLYTFTVPRTFFDFDSASKRIIEASSVADRIRVVIEGMIRHYSPLPNLVDPTKYDALPIHNLNLTVVDKIREFLNLSSITTEIQNISEPNFQNDNILWTIWNTLLDSANFFQAIANFNAEFMFQMNADYEGSAWLEWSQVNTDIGKREISVPLQNVTFSMANIFQLPILQVLVQANGLDLYGLTGDVGVFQGEIGPQPIELDSGQVIHHAIVTTGDTGTQMTSLARWPLAVPRNAIGVIYLLAPPRWLNPELTTFDLAAALSKLGDKKGHLQATIDAALSLKAEMHGAAKTRDQVMTYMAKQQFKKLYLETTTGQITIPLNLRVRPGYHYLVSSVTGETLFTGYLVSVSHDVMITSDSGAAATTSLGFTHIKAPGAVINALQDPPKFVTATLTVPQPVDPAGELKI